MISASNVDAFSVWREHNGVWSMLTTAIKFLKQLNRVQIAVAVSVPGAVQTAAATINSSAVHVDIKAIKGPEQSMSMADTQS